MQNNEHAHDATPSAPSTNPIDLAKLKALSDTLDRQNDGVKDDDSTVVEPFPVDEQHSIVTKVEEVLGAPAAPTEGKTDDRVRQGTRYGEYTGEFQED